MARMLYYLPDKHRKMIRYYGIYAHRVGDKLKLITRKTWAAAIEHSFNKNPELCPDCGAEMSLDPEHFPQLTLRYTPDQLRDQLVKMCAAQKISVTEENLHSCAANLESDLQGIFPD